MPNARVGVYLVLFFVTGTRDYLHAAPEQNAAPAQPSTAHTTISLENLLEMKRGYYNPRSLKDVALLGLVTSAQRLSSEITGSLLQYVPHTMHTFGRVCAHYWDLYHYGNDALRWNDVALWNNRICNLFKPFIHPMHGGNDMTRERRSKIINAEVQEQPDEQWTFWTQRIDQELQFIIKKLNASLVCYEHYSSNKRNKVLHQVKNHWPFVASIALGTALLAGSFYEYEKYDQAINSWLWYNKEKLGGIALNSVGLIGIFKSIMNKQPRADEIIVYIKEIIAYLQELNATCKNAQSLRSLNTEHVKRILSNLCNIFEHLGNLIDEHSATHALTGYVKFIKPTVHQGLNGLDTLFANPSVQPA